MHSFNISKKKKKNLNMILFHIMFTTCNIYKSAQYNTQYIENIGQGL